MTDVNSGYCARTSVALFWDDRGRRRSWMNIGLPRGVLGDIRLVSGKSWDGVRNYNYRYAITCFDSDHQDEIMQKYILILTAL